VRNVNRPDVQSLVHELGDHATVGSIEEAIAFGQKMGRHLAFKVLTR
jgi:hypothetical protein